METDRGAVLTRRAARDGRINFREADVLDVNWWRRVNLILREVAAEYELLTNRMTFDYQLALIANPNLKPEAWQAAHKLARELFHGTFNLLHPWAAKSIAEIEADELNALVDIYRREIGDPRDPTFWNKLNSDITSSRTKRLAARAAKESEDDRIERLIRERDARNRLAPR